MTTLADHMRQLEPNGQRRSSGPRSNIDANYNTAPFGMNNYVVEYSSIKPVDDTKDIIEKYSDDSPEDKAYNKKLLTRQVKPEVVEVTLGTNTNDNLEFLITGSEE